MATLRCAHVFSQPNILALFEPLGKWTSFTAVDEQQMIPQAPRAPRRWLAKRFSTLSSVYGGSGSNKIDNAVCAATQGQQHRDLMSGSSMEMDSLQSIVEETRVSKWEDRRSTLLGLEASIGFEGIPTKISQREEIMQAAVRSEGRRREDGGEAEVYGLNRPDSDVQSNEEDPGENQAEIDCNNRQVQSRATTKCSNKVADRSSPDSSDESTGSYKVRSQSTWSGKVEKILGLSQSQKSLDKNTLISAEGCSCSSCKLQIGQDDKAPGTEIESAPPFSDTSQSCRPACPYTFAAPAVLGTLEHREQADISLPPGSTGPNAGSFTMPQLAATFEVYQRCTLQVSTDSFT